VPFEEIFQWATNNFAASFIGGVVLAILIVYFLFAVVAFIQGREVTLLPMKIGVHPDKRSSQSPANLQVTVDHGEARLSDEQWAKLIKLVRSKPSEIGGAELPPAPNPPNLLPGIPERIQRVLQIRWAIQQKVRELGFGSLDGWAGISMASPETFLQLLKEYGHIDPELADSIGSFLGESGIASYESDISEEHLAYIEDLGSEILPRIPPPPEHPPWMDQES